MRKLHIEKNMTLCINAYKHDKERFINLHIFTRLDSLHPKAVNLKCKSAYAHGALLPKKMDLF